MIQIEYKKINEIAQNLDCGMTCYLNIKTAELIDVPENYEDFDDEDAIEMFGDILEKIKNPDFKEISVLDSHENFLIMQKFLEKVENAAVRSKLESALDGKRPFANFKKTIDNSDYIESWFAHKQQELENYVREELEMWQKEADYQTKNNDDE